MATVTITDIAKHANVSKSTVSRIINNEQYVAPATAKAVEAAIKELGYVPRAVRPGPKTSKRKGIKTGSIAFLSIIHTPEEMFALPAFPALMAGIQRGTEREGLELILSHMKDAHTLPPSLAHGRIDGAIIFGPIPQEGPLREALARTPGVGCYVAHQAPSTALSHVLYDNSHVGQLAAEYLLKQGHTHFAFMGDSPSKVVYQQRRNQFVRHLHDHQMKTQIIESPYPTLQQSARHASEMVDELLALPTRPTGIFCVTADLMLSTFNALRQRGIEPQRDIELIGCNNDPSVMNQMHPRPATIDIKLDVVGEVAVEQLIWRITHPDEPPRGTLLVSPTLIPAEED